MKTQYLFHIESPYKIVILTAMLTTMLTTMFHSFDISAKDFIPLRDVAYKIGAMDKIKNNLNAAKSKLDDIFEDDKFQAVWTACDPFKKEKKIISSIANTTNVSNAWLKCYEMLCYYEMLPKLLADHEKFIHFDNAAFPGAFILSTHHYVNTRLTWGANYSWRGSSLIEKNELDAVPLEDKYKLFHNYRENWLMDEKNNGDVLLRANQLDFMRKLDHGVNLYTSDLGFDVSSDFNNQELLQCPANIGQILSGLLTLKNGGCLITKQYTFFEPVTISVMYAASVFFKQFFICKPATSRAANSETYLVGLDFCPPPQYEGDKIADHPYIRALFDKIETGNTIISLFDAASYPRGYLTNIVKIASILSSSQAEKIEADIARYEKKENLDEYKASLEPFLEEWYFKNYVLPIYPDLRLNTVDVI